MEPLCVQKFFTFGGYRFHLLGYPGIRSPTPLFKCQWVKVTGGGVTVDNEFGMTIVDLSNIGYKDEPFVLAKDVNQVFYVNDMSTKPIVLIILIKHYIFALTK